ncbi:putative Non-classical export protein 2 [Rhizodiscina lignyota]|uniref:Non-classical export protein 2 n=1 Tax=Rhizodiscina lignyota TaxID=1504668 RepID=A0A9P4MA02_9PEZI|nr:putative Non-classical export protein 2 [Rhizodiscina lignyota]
MASKVLNLALRGFQFLWTLLIMALVGNMIATAFGGNPSIVNYDMFVSVFGMLSLFYLIPATLWDSLEFHPIIMVALDALNTLFFLIGGIATAAELGVHSCSNAHYTLHNHVTNGSPDRAGRCHEAQASTAFLWFGFAAFAASTFFSFLNSRGSANTRGIGIRRGGPAMSQV